MCIHSKGTVSPEATSFCHICYLITIFFVSLALPFCALFTRYIPAEPFTLNVAVFCPAGTLNDFTLAPLAENTIISDPFSLLSLKFTCMSAPLLAMVEERFIPPGTVLTFQDVMAVGFSAIVMDAIIVCGTIGLGILVGRLLKIDRSIALLTACGSAICGAAAVLGVDGAIRPKPYKTAVAVATVVIFGTLSMFLYPILYRAGIFDLSPDMMGLFTGSTVHEVAHVVGAANAMGAEVSNNAIIVKMIRVMMLVPVLLVIAWTVARDVAKRDNLENTDTNKPKISIPWFAILFLVVIGFNSLGLLPESIVDWINQLDTFLLTMAMAALGAETSFDKFKKAGIKPFLLAAILYCWLIGGGYCLVKFAIPYLQ